MLRNFFFEMPTNDVHDNKGAAAIALKLPKDKWKQHWAPPPTSRPCAGARKLENHHFRFCSRVIRICQSGLNLNDFFLKIRSLPPGHKEIDICVQSQNQPMLSNECDCSIIKCKSSEKLFLWFKVAASFRFKCWQNKLPQQRITECCKKMQLVQFLWMNQFPCLSASFTLVSLVSFLTNS